MACFAIAVLFIAFSCTVGLATPALPSSLDSATAGHTFSGAPIRSVSAAERLFSPNNVHQYPTLGNECDNWVVVTTIFAPTALFDQIANDTSSEAWCVVVVGDKKSEPWMLNQPRFVFLSAEDQKQLPYVTVSALPWNHFGRKNIGYLYAIHHGAKWIYDTDDDNMLSLGRIPLADVTTRVQKRASPVGTVYNPYPDFQPLNKHRESAFAWPRGFPLDRILDETTHGFVSDAVVSNVTVFQSLANHDPDVDSIFRLTRATQLFFAEDDLSIGVPSGVMSPTNAQATLFEERAFWSLLLPISVHGRVSDIWRGLLAQRIMWQTGQHIAFVSAFVTQCRNSHEFLADFNSEVPLFERSGRLIDILIRWQPSSTSLIDLMNEGVLLLYERGVLSWDDVTLARAWITDLVAIGYSFPRANVQFVRETSVSPVQNDSDRAECESVVLARSHSTMCVAPDGTRYDCSTIFDPSFYRSQLNASISLTIGTGNDAAFNHWLRFGVAHGLRAHRGQKVLKIVLMTRNEWPLLFSWVHYHGKVAGYPNLYVLDGSDDERVEKFLRECEKLGVTVIRHMDNLNTIVDEMNRLMSSLRSSCDYLIKLDTDEFVILMGPDGQPVTHTEIMPYLDRLHTTGSRMRVGFDMMSVPSRQLCRRNISDVLTNTEFRQPGANVKLKAFFNAWTFGSVDLGSHGGTVSNEFQTIQPQVTHLGIAHYHWLCYDQVQANNRNVLLSNGFLRSNIPDKQQINTRRAHLRGPNHDKVSSYLAHLENPISSRDIYYNITVSHGAHQSHLRCRKWTDIRDAVLRAAPSRQQIRYDFDASACRQASERYANDYSTDVESISSDSAWSHFVGAGVHAGYLWLGMPCAHLGPEVPPVPRDESLSLWERKLLVIVFNDARFFDNFPKLALLYTPAFGDRIRFTGYAPTAEELQNNMQGSNDNDWMLFSAHPQFIPCRSAPRDDHIRVGPRMHVCLADVFRATQAIPDVDGVVWVADDMFFDYRANGTYGRADQPWLRSTEVFSNILPSGLADGRIPPWEDHIHGFDPLWKGLSTSERIIASTFGLGQAQQFRFSARQAAITHVIAMQADCLSSHDIGNIVACAYAQQHRLVSDLLLAHHAVGTFVNATRAFRGSKLYHDALAAASTEPSALRAAFQRQSEVVAEFLNTPTKESIDVFRTNVEQLIGGLPLDFEESSNREMFKWVMTKSFNDFGYMPLSIAEDVCNVLLSDTFRVAFVEYVMVSATRLALSARQARGIMDDQPIAFATRCQYEWGEKRTGIPHMNSNVSCYHPIKYGANERHYLWTVRRLANRTQTIGGSVDRQSKDAIVQKAIEIGW